MGDIFKTYFEALKARLFGLPPPLIRISSTFLNFPNYNNGIRSSNYVFERQKRCRFHISKRFGCIKTRHIYVNAVKAILYFTGFVEDKQ